MHKLLQRQLTRLQIPNGGTPPDAAQWTKLLERIERTYTDADQERYTLERSISLSSLEMTALHERLKAERDKLRGIFESAALGILSVDGDKRILDANPAAIHMLGLPRDGLVGRRLVDLFEDSVPMSTINPIAEDVPLAERRYDRPDGTTAWFHTTGTWVRDEGGAIQQGTVVVEDITTQKILEGSLRHAQRLESVGRLAAGIAHEINTPIQFVNDNVHFLRDAFGSVVALVATLEGELASRGQEAAGKCQEAAEAADWTYLGDEIPRSILQSIDGLQRIATIVHSMKAFAHNDQGKQAPTDLNAALSSTLVVAGHELKGVAIAEEDFGDIPAITCYRGDLNQVFLNLIVNAAHAIRDANEAKGGGELGRIRVSTRIDGDHVAVAISDTGSGISAEVAPRMFEPFFTTKEVGRGSGQGLALARGIVVNKHRGTIDFETRVGVGTTFTVRLPIAGACSGATEEAA